MKKPSLTSALATKAPVAPSPVVTPAPKAAARAPDSKIATTVRIAPADLEALKIIAAKQRGVKVNDLILQGVAHVLALNAAKS